MGYHSCFKSIFKKSININIGTQILDINHVFQESPPKIFAS